MLVNFFYYSALRLSSRDSADLLRPNRHALGGKILPRHGKIRQSDIRVSANRRALSFFIALPRRLFFGLS
jgi:hypothetical protein